LPEIGQHRLGQRLEHDRIGFEGFDRADQQADGIVALGQPREIEWRRHLDPDFLEPGPAGRCFADRGSKLRPYRFPVRHDRVMQRPTPRQGQAQGKDSLFGRDLHGTYCGLHGGVEFIPGRQRSDVDGEVMPAGDVSRNELDRADADADLRFDDHAALGSGLPRVAPLRVAGENDPGRLTDDFPIVNMSQRPVIVALVAQAIGRCRRVGLVSFPARQGGVQNADVQHRPARGSA
jgi:hypothetical protein